MRVTRVALENWKNFRRVDLALQRRAFIIGPNASGKSNLLDAVRFLRDVADPQGGFQRAVNGRGGITQVRCLHARAKPVVVIELQIDLEETWTYRLEFTQDRQRKPVVSRELVLRGTAIILDRPNKEDRKDPDRLSQTHLEQVNANREFRVVAEFLSMVRYLHVVPQLIRDTERVGTRPNDPYGSDFLERIATTPKKTLESRLRRINQALRVAVPQLKSLELARDARGVPHLKGLYEHWRPNAGWQTEEHFSDGTLRLLGLLWALIEGRAPLLLEEPELSLHAEVVRYIPSMMNRVIRREGRQIIVSTHSSDLLSDESIAPEEVVILEPTSDGTRARLASDVDEVKVLHAAGSTMADAALPHTAPRGVLQLALFADR